MKKTGIITINYNTEDLVERFARSIQDQSNENWIMLIVNNSPSDQLLKRLMGRLDDRRIMMLGINENVGYSKANNLGFEHLFKNRYIEPDDHVMISNEDIVIEDKDLLGKTEQYFKECGCSFIGPRIINNDGSQMLPHQRETNYLKSMLHIGNNGVVDRIFGINRQMRDITRPVQVFLLNGACFFVRAGDFDKVGMFESNTFIYYEEEFLFRKVRKHGLKVMYNPELVVLHEHSGSVKKNFNILNKKRFVLEGEMQLIRNVLRVNRLLVLLFILERKLEFLLFSISIFFKRMVKGNR